MLASKLSSSVGTNSSSSNYIEDVFSTYLYTNNTYPSNLTITNGIDLSGKGGLVWMKNRNLVRNHNLYDTARGAYKQLRSDSTGAEITNASGYGLTAFNADGFSLGTDIDGENYGNVVSWTFRKQKKFFDVVTYTGNGSGNRIITSSLGSPIGCVFIKRTDSTSNWATAHRKDGSAVATGLSLNTTAAALYPNSTNDTFDATGGFNAGYIVDSTGDGVNVNGATYVAYVFAHNAGGFGLTGTDNVISCGSFTTDASSVATVNLGYEPQWVMFKCTSTTDNWRIVDNMRGFANAGSSSDARLFPNSSSQEFFSDTANPTATGFVTQGDLQASQTYIYIAIRRGPMKVPTDATKVFSPQTATYSANQVVTTGFPVDMLMMKGRTITFGNLVYDRLRGLASTNTSPYDAALFTSDTSAETAGDYTNTANNTGYQISPGFSGFSSVNWNFQRAPSFFDEVCYTGTGTNQFINHNLGVRPDLYIVKRRSATANWAVTVNASIPDTVGILNSSNAFGGTAYDNGYLVNGTVPASNFGAGFGSVNNDAANASGSTYVAYLFATCAGVSKVGSYTGTGTTLQIDCGFTGGARFVLIKRSDSTGDWYVWDSARGIVSGNDPYLLLNSTAAEVTSTDYIDTYSAGFEISSTAPSAINASGGTFIFLAIA